MAMKQSPAASDCVTLLHPIAYHVKLLSRGHLIDSSVLTTP